MAREKSARVKIKRRSPGLVITPPAPRPAAADHPARLLFREAVESARAAPGPEAPDSDVADAATPSATPEPAAGGGNVTHDEPLQIFKELKGRPSAEQSAPVPTVTASRGEHSEAFESYFGQWRPFLPEAQMCVLEALYNMTHALGGDNCLTSMPKLAAAAGISERQTYNVVKVLERSGFVERPDTYNTPTKKGTVFRLHLSRQIHPSGPARRYHIGGEEN